MFSSSLSETNSRICGPDRVRSGQKGTKAQNCYNYFNYSTNCAKFLQKFTNRSCLEHRKRNLRSANLFLAVLLKRLPAADIFSKTSGRNNGENRSQEHSSIRNQVAICTKKREGPRRGPSRMRSENGDQARLAEPNSSIFSLTLAMMASAPGLSSLRGS